MSENSLPQMLDPVQLLEEKDMPVTLTVQLIDGDEQTYRWLLIEENGARHQGSFQQGELVSRGPGHASAGASDQGEKSRNQQSYFLDLGFSLPTGYHEFMVYGPDKTRDEPGASQLLIIAPSSCYMPPGISADSRVWGLSGYLHGIRSRDNWGIGDFSDAMNILGTSAERGAGLVHLGPLASCLNNHPGLVDSAAAHNPYSPSCRCQLNLLFIDVTAIDDFDECEAVRQLVEEADFQVQLTMLKDSEQLDYAEVYGIKDAQLRKLWDCFFANHLHPQTSRGDEFREFQHNGGETLYQHAVFSALATKFSTTERFASGWPSWPVEFRDFASPEVRQFAQDETYSIEYHQYLQWQAEKQLAALGRRSMELGLKVGLLMEFPFSVHAGGFEAWRYRKAMIEGASVAAHPLDNPGQDPAVGLPAFDPQQLRKMRFRPFIKGLQHCMRYAGALIFNSMGNYFETYLSFVGEDEKSQGSVSFPFSDMLGIIALESWRNRCLVIADNSHTLTKDQQFQLQQRNIFVSESFLNPDNEGKKWRPAADYQAKVAVRVSPPFFTTVKGFWQSRDIARQTAEKSFCR